MNIEIGIEKTKEEIFLYETLKNKYKEDLIIMLVPSKDFDDGFYNDLNDLEKDSPLLNTDKFLLNS